MIKNDRLLPGKTLDLPHRPDKPRNEGITAITDVGIPLGELIHILKSYHSLIDMAKLGIGTAYLEPLLEEKIACYKEYGIPVYFGGTLFEKYYSQGKLMDYLRFLTDCGIRCIEISSGTFDIPAKEESALIQQLKETFTILVEVGKKENDPSFTTAKWIENTQKALEAGCDYVVLEGRNTADAGIYNAKGTLDQSLIETILKTTDKNRLIFEAPTSKSQSQLINSFGANVNLGNIFARDLLLLETQRMGLREETFFTS